MALCPYCKKAEDTTAAIPGWVLIATSKEKKHTGLIRAKLFNH